MRFRTRLLALCMALFVLLPSTAMASVVYHCKMTNRVGPSCCCMSHEKQAARDGDFAKFERPACCTAERADSETLPGLTEDSRFDVPPAAMVPAFELPQPRTVAFRTRQLERRSRAPPPVGPPLFIRHCAFLT